MEENNYKVYMHVNKINDKKYVGITRRKPKDRWLHGNGYRRSWHFQNAIQKYGWDNFDHYILYIGLTKQEAEDKERELISYFDSANRDKGYNIELGGNSVGKISDEQKRKMSENHADYKRGNHPQSKKIICDNRIFDCVQDCSDYYGINYRTMNCWLSGNNKMPKKFYDMGLRYLEDNSYNIEIQIQEKKKVFCENIKFDSVKKCADYYGINHRTMNSWLNGRSNMPQEWYDRNLHYEDKEISDYIIQKGVNGGNNPKAKKIYCEGKIFKCIKDCATYYNIKPNTMQKWFLIKRIPKTFYDKKLHEEGIKMEEYVCVKEKSTIICDGKEYLTINECAKYYGVNPSNMSSWLRRKTKMPQKFIDLGLKYKNNPMVYKPQTGISKGNTHIKSKQVVCEGMLFSNIRECSEYYNENLNSMTNWIRHINSMPIKWYKRGLRYADETMEDYKIKNNRYIVCGDMDFDTIVECATYYNIKDYKLSKWLKGEKAMPQEFIDLNLHYEYINRKENDI